MRRPLTAGYDGVVMLEGIYEGLGRPEGAGSALAEVGTSVATWRVGGVVLSRASATFGRGVSAGRALKGRSGITEALCHKESRAMKVTRYFQVTRSRPDRAVIQDEWIQRVIESPEREYLQADGRVRRWARIEEMEGRYLRVVLLSDRETVHNAFFDRGYKP